MTGLSKNTSTRVFPTHWRARLGTTANTPDKECTMAGVVEEHTFEKPEVLFGLGREVTDQLGRYGNATVVAVILPPQQASHTPMMRDAIAGFLIWPRTRPASGWCSTSTPICVSRYRRKSLQRLVSEK